MKGKPWRLILALLLGFLLTNTTISANLPPYHENTTDSLSKTWSNDFFLSMSILVFGLVLCLAEIFVLFKKKEVSWDPSAFRVFGLTLIIVSGVFLITAGYSEYQIASMMGLLGTVAGYLLAQSQPDR